MRLLREERSDVDMKRWGQLALARLGFRLVPVGALSDIVAGPDAASIEAARRYSMGSRERLAAVAQSVRYVERAGISGAIVECGVWRGGAMMVAALTLKSLGTLNRDLYLFDTFEGMTEPSGEDERWSGQRAQGEFARRLRKDGRGSDWCRATLDDVSRNMATTDYPSAFVHYRKGPVEQTLPAEAPERIAVLRLDTDWYESTRHELIHLYPRLEPGGLLIIDDYGTWLGARKAVDEYFAGRHEVPYLARIDHTCRLLVKPPTHSQSSA